VHVGGVHTDEQLGDANIRESSHLQHVGEHPRFTEERVMRRRPRTPDGKPFEALEEHSLRGCRQAPAPA